MEQELQTILQECDTLKARLSAMRPLPVEALKKIEDALAIEYTYESNRIEGNTLTLQETELVVNEGVTIVLGSIFKLLLMQVRAIRYTIRS